MHTRAYGMPQRGTHSCAHAQANYREPCSRITASGAASIVALVLQLLLAAAGGWAQTAAAQQRGEKTALRTRNAPATSTPRTGWRVLARGRAIIRIARWAQDRTVGQRHSAARPPGGCG